MVSGYKVTFIGILMKVSFDRSEQCEPAEHHGSPALGKPGRVPSASAGCLAGCSGGEGGGVRELRPWGGAGG